MSNLSSVTTVLNGNQVMNSCLGTKPENQILFHHLTTGCLDLVASQVIE